jgi:hypothetical protein
MRHGVCLNPRQRRELGRVLSLSGLPSPLDLLGRRAARVVGTLGAGSAIGPCCNALSILSLGLAATGCLSGRYPIRVLVSSCTFARIRVVSSSRLTIAANGFAACVFGATCLA